MSNHLSRLKALSASTRAKQQSGGATAHGESIPLVVEGFDLQSNPNTVIGRHLITQKPVRIFMRPDHMAEKRRSPRYEVADWHGGRGTLDPVQPGGTILFKHCHLDHEVEGGASIYSAFWGEVLSCDAEQASVLNVLSNVKIYRPRPDAAEDWAKKGNFLVNMLFTDKQTQTVATSQELRDHLGKWLQQDLPFMRYAALIGTTTDGERLAFEARPIRGQDRSALPGPESADAFLKGEIGSALVEALDGGLLQSLTMVPGFQVYAGSAYRDKMLKNASMIGAYHDMYHFDDGTGEVAAYVPSILAIRAGDNGARFVTAVEATDGARTPRFNMENIPLGDFEGISLPTLEQVRAGGNSASAGSHEANSATPAPQNNAPSMPGI